MPNRIENPNEVKGRMIHSREVLVRHQNQKRKLGFGPIPEGGFSDFDERALGKLSQD